MESKEWVKTSACFEWDGIHNMALYNMEQSRKYHVERVNVGL